MVDISDKIERLKEAGLWRCESCRAVGMIHCQYPDECGEFDVEKLTAKLEQMTLETGDCGVEG